jgi:MFS family permease
VKPISLLFVALFNSILGLSVLFPVLGPLGRQLGFTELQVGAFSTAYALMQFVMSAYWGRLSERKGRKPVLLMGIVGFGVGFLAFGAVAELALRGIIGHWPAFGLMLCARLAGGAFSSATIPTAQAYVADVTGREKRSAGMAVIGAAFGLGIIFGPGIGAVLSNISLLAPVYFSAGSAFLNALFVVWKLPEPKERLAPIAGDPLVSSDARIWPLLLVGAVISLASVAMEQTIAFYFQDRLGLSGPETAGAVGTALVIYGIVAVIAQGYFVRRYQWGPATLLRIGLPIALVGFCMLIFAADFTWLAIALATQGLGTGLIGPGVTAALSLSVRDDQQGAVAGLNSAAQGLGRMLGPLIGTGLYQVRPAYPYVLSACLLALVSVFLLSNRRVLSHTAV